ncbi:hypothetical protein A2415_04270 [candidate division WWE3 bacterium RIFOXYC1_FULL_39_7]|uniref:Uncharacterized protein n=2 Tax=Katanobacteria TaxID=422282 RepID=A0A1F4X7H5_UNCKA|nr:MAG: hypothetical protein A2415_04270 [candidate division WWE3 bacterium RIFOXYC1_FULL_39_7]OGC77665.1 MAG: hypothetical protein A2619_05525 [candidate division WWE3 bacterium RIFOXYD1_FULL_39_9]
MRALIVLIILTGASFMMFLQFKLRPFSKEMYLEQKVLEMSVPFDVKIDIEFLKSLVPANE